MPMRDETKTIKPNINEAFVASTGDIITDYNNFYCVFYTLPRLHLCSEKTTNNKHYSTQLKSQFLKYETYLVRSL